MLWDSTYNAVGGAANNANVFSWSNADPDVSPINTGAVPFGIGAAAGASAFNPLNTTALALKDPINQFVASGIVADAKVISACLQATYFGTMLDSSGQIGFIQNLPVRNLLEGGNGGTPCSVTDLFNNCTKTERLGLKTMEVISRPMNGTELFHTQYNGSMEVHAAGSTPSVTTYTYTTTPTCVCGFIWRSTDNQSRIVFDMIKNSAWRPNPTSGLANPIPITLGDPMLHEVHRLLDKNAKGWASRTKSDQDSKLSEALTNPHHPGHRRAKHSFWNSLVGAATGVYNYARSPQGQQMLASGANYVAREVESAEYLLLAP